MLSLTKDQMKEVHNFLVGIAREVCGEFKEKSLTHKIKMIQIDPSGDKEYIYLNYGIPKRNVFFRVVDYSDSMDVKMFQQKEELLRHNSLKLIPIPIHSWNNNRDTLKQSITADLTDWFNK